MTNSEKTKLQKEILDSLPPLPSGRLLLSPRSGKTKVIIDLIKRDKPLSILWVTPSSELASKDIPKEFDIWKAKKYKKRLSTVTWKSLPNATGEYDIIVLDEDQFITPVNAANLLDKTLVGNTIISMTGTPSKDKIKNELYEALELEPLYELSINQAVDIKLLADYEIKVIKVPMSTSKTLKVGSKKKSWLSSEKLQYDYLNKVANAALFNGAKDKTFKVLNRMRAIKSSPSKTNIGVLLAKKLSGRKLIFASTIAQSELLSPFRYNSKTKNDDLIAFKEGRINSLALVNSGGTGFTYKRIDHLIMVQADSDNNGLTSQKISRTLLGQPDYKAVIWIICLMDTQDETWVNAALKRFDETKIEFLSTEQLKHYLSDENKQINQRQS